MKRFIAIGVVVLVVALAVAGVALLASSDGPSAARIGETSISRDYVNDELRVLGENETLREAVRAAQAPVLSNAPGSVTSEVSAGWLGLLIAQELAAREVERLDLQTTDADRDRGRQLATESIGGPLIFESVPNWFRERLVSRWTPVAALQRRVVDDPPPELVQQLSTQCPSGRYVSHILVENEAEAVAIKQALDQGGDFAELARQSSTDPGSAEQGGFLGCADGQSFVEPFATVVATQPLGVVSDPFTTEFGSHIVLVTGAPPAGDLEQAAIELALSAGRGVAVDVDPRYGIWDRGAGQVLPQPVAGAAPPPVPTG